MVNHSWPLGTIYKYRNVLGFIATEGAGSTEPGDPYLSRFPGGGVLLFAPLFVLTCQEGISMHLIQ